MPARAGPARWPPWLAALAWLIAVAGVWFVDSALTRFYVLVGGDAGHLPPALTALGTLAQSLLLVVTAIGLGWWLGATAAGDFGLRAAPGRRAVAWTASVALALVAVVAGYRAVAGPLHAHDVAESLGVDHGSVNTLGAAIIAIVVAPAAEELLFRGLGYRALRNRLSVPAASGIVALGFASIHYGGPDTWSLLPLFALLGVACCVLYERIGSLYPAIALHTTAASVALGWTLASADRLLVSAACGVVALGACAVVPWRQRDRDPPSYRRSVTPRA